MDSPKLYYLDKKFKLKNFNFGMPYLKQKQKHTILYISEIFSVALLYTYAFALRVVFLGNEGSQYEEVNWVLRSKLLNSR